MFVFDDKLIFGAFNSVVFYVSIKHVTCFLQGMLKISSSGLSSTVHFRGTEIKLRHGYAPSHSPKPTHVYFYRFMVGRSYITQRY